MELKYQIDDVLVEKVKAFLKEDGLAFFRENKSKYGTVSPVLKLEVGDSVIPYPVHFHEGMQVRNFMRSTGLCKEWDDIDYDDNWMKVIEKAIE